MNSPKQSETKIDLENDLPVTPEDLQALSRPLSEQNRDLAGYLAFLDEIGAFVIKKTSVKIYSEVFTL